MKRGLFVNTFAAFVRIAFKSNFAYRSSVLMGFLGSIFSIIVQIAIWQYVFRKDTAMSLYMTAYVVLSQFIRIMHKNDISSKIGYNVASGNFVIDLIKPVDTNMTYWSMSMGTMLADIFTMGLPILLIFSFAFVYIKFSLTKVVAFLTICIMNCILLRLMYILIGYLAFIVIEIWPFSRMLEDTIRFFSGAIIPIAFFPDWLKFISEVLPFHLIYSFPIRIILEELPVHELVSNILLIGLWCFAFFSMLFLVYKRAIWHSVVQGG